MLLIFWAPFLTISFAAVGVEGGCPAERDNEGCFFLGETLSFRPSQPGNSHKEFCDCVFAWQFSPGDAQGASQGKTLPAFATAPRKTYEKRALSPENAAAIPCRQVLGSYVVRWERGEDPSEQGS